jgi:pSer/pThr/pTyr-binding forkhead associated (FHA) protein
MPFFLEVQSGSRKGEKIRLNLGQVVRIGRSAKSDFAFDDDSHMSSAHFSVDWRVDGCHLGDLKSRNGTLVNGQKVDSATLKHGDTIAAGETAFLVRIEGEEAGFVDTEANVSADATPQERLLHLMRLDFQPLYAVLDAARDVKILALLLKSNEEYQSLYEGPQGAKLAQVAPYLVRLKKDSLLLEKLVRDGWGESWGVYLTCASEFNEVRRHLRHFLEVTLPEGEQVYFRYYDPRVLRVYLPTCTFEEADSFFGPIKNYFMEDEDPDSLLQFSNRGHGAVRTAIKLSPEIAGTAPQPGTAVSQQEATADQPR